MPKWFTILAKAERTEILIYDQIGKDWFGGDGVSAKEFAEALKEIPAKTEILICINSPGGNVWDGLAIYNQLKARREYVTARVDGVAASIASIIALAGKSLEMPKNSLLMIHDPSGMVMGNAEDMRDMAARLDSHADLLAGIYAEKTGKSREYMRGKMLDETWFDGEQAMATGLADSVIDEIKIAASTFSLDGFRRVPAVLKAQLPAKTAGQQNKADTMNKKAILALLAEHGKPLAEDSKEEAILAALAGLVMANKVTQEQADALKTEEPEVLIKPSEFRAMQARLKEEKERRITNEFLVIAANRPALKSEDWLPKLFADESLMDTLKKMPVQHSDPYTDPVGRGGSVQNNGNATIEAYKKMKPGKERSNFRIENWHGLEQAFEQHRIIAMASLPVHEQIRRIQSPRANNTFSASLVTDHLSDQFITTIGTKLAALKGFSTQFGTDQLKPRATVQVSKATVGATTQTNPTNFESGDSTTTNVAVAVAQISQDFHVTNDQLNSGHTLARIAAKNAQSFANALSDIWTALVTTGNFGTGLSIGAAATFDASDLAPIYAAAKNYGSKNLILDGGHLAYLLPTDKFKFRLGEEGAYNFDLIAEQNRWTGATANTVGLICDPGAIAVASGLPMAVPAGEFIELGTVTVEGLDLTVQMAHWFSRAGRVHWMSYDVMFGAAAGDTTAGEVLLAQ